MDSNSTQKRLLLTGLGIAVLLLIGFNGYYFFASNKSSTPSPSQKGEVPQSIKKKIEQESSKLTADIKAQEKEALAEKSTFKEACRLTSLNPTAGIESTVRITENLSDNFYKLRLSKYERTTITKSGVPCNVAKLTLKSRVPDSDDIILYLPAGITHDLGIGIVSPLFYKNQLGNELLFRLQLEKTNSVTDPYKILEWQPLRSFIN